MSNPLAVGGSLQVIFWCMLPVQSHVVPRVSGLAKISARGQIEEIRIAFGGSPGGWRPILVSRVGQASTSSAARGAAFAAPSPCAPAAPGALTMARSAWARPA